MEKGGERERDGKRWGNRGEGKRSKLRTKGSGIKTRQKHREGRVGEGNEMRV